VNRKILLLLAVCLGFAARDGIAAPAPRRRALLIGINDYTASRLGVRPRTETAPQRDWPNLAGAVNDVGALEEMLGLLYGFDKRDIKTLTNQEATRSAILDAVENHLLKHAGKGDVLLFYYAGHGSQVLNSLSNEPDRLDESIVPADSRLGVRDIRDKELRPFFNGILDRGARLTVILDNCHSGSGARGLATGAQPRGVKPDLRDIADRTSPGPRPEEHGALVISATQDFDIAWESRDEEGKMHGAFSWAWIRAMRDSTTGETAAETFARASARLRAEKPYQEPVLAGNREVTLSPFLGIRSDRRGDRTVISVEKVRRDGAVLLQGGWANGLTVGTELRVWGDGNDTVGVPRSSSVPRGSSGAGAGRGTPRNPEETRGTASTRLTITGIQGLGRSEGRFPAGTLMPAAIRSGALMEVVGWAAPMGRSLRVSMPRVTEDRDALTSLARKLAAEATRHRVHWIDDPIESTPSFSLRRGQRGWELLRPDGGMEVLGPDAADAINGVAGLPAAASLFVQLPAPAALIDAIDVGPGSDREGIDPIDRPEDADYVLVGRYSNHSVEYTWMRPTAGASDRRRAGLPLRTAWIAETLRDTASALRDAAVRLRKIQAWQLLDSPAESRSPYRLELRRERDGQRATDCTLIGDEKYALVLRAAAPVPARVTPRYVYVFMVDSYGESFLLFPRSGSVENRFPMPSSTPPAEISLGAHGTFEIAPPYGVDTYFLLTTDEPLRNPWILEWDGVRSRPPQPQTALEELLLLTASGSRARVRSTLSSWSVERLFFESIPPREAKIHTHVATNFPR
jgi:hypothetical protein